MISFTTPREEMKQTTFIEFEWQIFQKYGKGLGHKDVLSLKIVRSIKGNRINWWNTINVFSRK